MDKFDLLCNLQAISNFAYDIHYTAKGRNFYSDHIFSERLADVDVMDDFIETFYLGESEDAPDSSKISAKVAEITPKPVNDTQMNFKTLREMIVKVLIAIQNYKGTKGEEDLLGSVAHILQRHNGLLFRELVYTPEEIRNSDEEWENLVTAKETMGGELNNEKWITVHPNKENPDDYRRLKVEDGETSEEAVDRKFGKKKEDKEPEKDDKKEPEKEEKKETEKDTESEEEDLTKLSDDELEKRYRDISDKQYNYFKEKENYIHSKLKSLKDEKESIREKIYNYRADQPEYQELMGRWKELNEKIRTSEYELEDEYDKQNIEKKIELSNKSAKIFSEKNRRYREQKQKQENTITEINKKIQDLARDELVLSDEEYNKKKQDIEKEIKESGLGVYDVHSLQKELKNKLGILKFDKKVKNIQSKVKEYSNKTDKLIEKLNNIELPSDEYERKMAEKLKEEDELVEKYNKSSNQEEKKEIEEKIEKLGAERRAGFLTSSEKISKNIQKMKEILVNELGNTDSEIIIPKTRSGSVANKRYNEISNALNGLIGKGVNTQNAPAINGRRGRAHFDPTKNEITISDYYTAETAVHEYMHYIEENNPNIIENSKAFLEYRTKGENISSLRKLTGLNYSSWEVTKKDKFFNPYCGKIYGGKESYRNADATELMSMGVQRLLTDGKNFAKEDREYFDFVIANLRGEL